MVMANGRTQHKAALCGATQPASSKHHEHELWFFTMETLFKLTQEKGNLWSIGVLPGYNTPFPPPPLSSNLAFVTRKGY